MKAFSRRIRLVFPLLLLAASASAQWSVVAPKLLGIDTEYGAMQFRDGVVWAGCSNLWSSKDSGMTWQEINNFSQDMITDIAFYDKVTGLVCTLKGVFLTKDGGKNWSRVLNDEFRKVSFNGSSKIMHALTYLGILWSSADGGLNWYESNAGSTTRSIAVANDRNIYVMDQFQTGNFGGSSISKDIGKSWSAHGQIIDGDCYTISVDSCDPKRLYLVGEQAYNPTDEIAKLSLSLDGGVTWQTTASHDIHSSFYYSGAMTTTKYGVFVGTLSKDGVLRSMDQGMTWKAIGGPAISADSRMIAAVDDNIILASDSAGTIWLTRNSGGDSLAAHPADVVTFTPSSLFATDTIHCDSIVGTVHISRTCFAPYPGQVSIAGPDSSSFRLISSNGDSASIMLVPNSTGKLNASLVVNLSNGKSDTVPLQGFSTATPYKYSFTPASLFKTDTVQCDSIPRSVRISRTGCFGANPKQLTIAGPDSASFQILYSDSDSVLVNLLPNSTGPLNASLLIKLSDGTNDSLSLLGYCKTAIWDYSFAPANLFSKLDSPYLLTTTLIFSAPSWDNTLI